MQRGQSFGKRMESADFISQESIPTLDFPLHLVDMKCRG